MRMGKGSGKRSGRGSSIHGVSRVMKDSLSVEMVEGIGMNALSFEFLERGCFDDLSAGFVRAEERATYLA